MLRRRQAPAQPGIWSKSDLETLAADRYETSLRPQVGPLAAILQEPGGVAG